MESATLLLIRNDTQNYTDITVTVYRVTSDWLGDTPGASETNVTWNKRDVAGDLDWAGGAFSASDYTTEGAVECQFVPGFGKEQVFDITPIIQGIYDSGENNGFVIFQTHGNGNLTLKVRSSEADPEAPDKHPTLTIAYSYLGSGGTLIMVR